MPGRPKEYLTAIAYPRLYHREHSPLWLATVATALGHAAPEPAGARFCEIGCGSGFGATVFAAADPAGYYQGVDINPAHIDAGQALAREAGIGNVDLVRGDVRDLAAAEGEPFDFIIAHGLYSWVSAEVQAAIRAFIAKRLAPGGVAYLHYTTLPGAAPFASFHALFRDISATGAGDAEAIRRGMSLLETLRERKAGFFQAHPHAAATLEHLGAEDPGYMAHEYLNPDYAPLAVGDVVRSMAAAGLSYVGSATPIENIDAVSLPANLVEIVRGETDPGLRETLKDMARNQALRRDLFMKSPTPLAAARHLDVLRSQKFTLLPGAPAPGRLTFDTRIGAVEGDEAIFRPLLSHLAKGSATFGEIERVAPFATRPGLLNQALQMLLWAGAAHPVPLASPDAAPARRLNKILVAQSESVSIPALCAPSIGGGVPVDQRVLDAIGGRAGAALHEAAVRKLAGL